MMKNKLNALVSIIVPIYNMEKYLEKCVNSITSQSYDNLEIILSDDGSTDNSPEICDNFAKKDSRIKVIHKKNGGLSDARNAGLDIMTGDYVAFFDSDDFIEKDAVKNLLITACENNCKISHMKSYIVDSDYNIVCNQSGSTNKVTILSSEEYIKGICEKRLSESVCDKLFASEIFDNRRFQKGRLNEDFLFLSEILFEGYDIAQIDYSGYNYYQRPGSITNSGSKKSLADAVKNSYELKEKAKAQRPELEKYFARLTLFQARTMLIVMPWNDIKNNNDVYVNTLKYLRDSIGFVNSVLLSAADKIFIKSVNLCPKLTLRITSLIWRLKK